MTAGDAPQAGRREWLGLAVLALPTLLVSVDLFVLLLALPNLSQALGASNNQQLWITDMYGFILAGFLITMGNVGDRVGRRRLLLVGGAVFGAASLLSAYSTSPGMLITARALLGVAGATLTPSTLALISNMFRNERQRAFAIGVWVGCFTVGAIIGPMIGGVLLAHFWWGSVFLLSVPVMALLLVLGPMLLPEYRAPQSGRIDLASVALSLAAILPFIYGIKELARHGWHLLPAVAAVAGLVIGVLFVRRQHRLSDPLLDLRLFGGRSFSTALVSLLSFSLVGGTTMLFITQYFQLVDGLSPLRAGLGLLPGMVTSTVSVMIAPIIARRVRPAYLIGTGLIGVVATLLVFTQVNATAGSTAFVIGFAVMSLCGGPLVALGTNLVVGAAPPEKAGSAASMAQTSNEFGAALGIAILGTIGTAVYRAQLADHLSADVPGTASQAAGESIAGAVTAAAKLPGRLNTALLAPAHDAFTSGLHAVAGISAALLAGIAILVLTMLRHVPPFAAAAPSADATVDDSSAAATGASAATHNEAQD